MQHKWNVASAEWVRASRVPKYTDFGELSGVLFPEQTVPSIARDTDPAAITGWLDGASGTESSFDRNALGTLLTEEVNGTEVWRGASDVGPAYTAVTVDGESEYDLTWTPEGRLESDGQRTFDWSHDGFLSRVESTEVGWEERVYDALGRPVRVTGSDGMRDLVYAGADVIEEFEIVDGTDCARVVWYVTPLLNRPAGYEVEILDECAADVHRLRSVESTLGTVDRFAMIQDLSADVVGLVNEQGIVVTSAQYDLHGHRSVAFAAPSGVEVCNESALITCPSPFGNPLGYAGARHSSVTGLYDMRARHYDPSLRIFVSRDPLLFVDGFDTWQYASGDPFNLWDPFGLSAEVRAGVGVVRDSPLDLAGGFFGAYADRMGHSLETWATAPLEPYRRIRDNALTIAGLVDSFREGGPGAGLVDWLNGHHPVDELIESGQAFVQGVRNDRLDQAGTEAFNTTEATIQTVGAIIIAGSMLRSGRPGARPSRTNSSAQGRLSLASEAPVRPVGPSPPIAEGVRPTTTSQPSGVPGPDFVPNRNITTPYKRPTGTPTAQQRAAVQGLPCVDCSVVEPVMRADHIEALIVEYYRTGGIDMVRARSLSAVQAQCRFHSAQQGGFLAGFSRRMKNILGL